MKNGLSRSAEEGRFARCSVYLRVQATTTSLTGADTTRTLFPLQMPSPPPVCGAAALYLVGSRRQAQREGPVLRRFHFHGACIAMEGDRSGHSRLRDAGRTPVWRSTPETATTASPPPPHPVRSSVAVISACRSVGTWRGADQDDPSRLTGRRWRRCGSLSSREVLVQQRSKRHVPVPA